MTQIQEIHDEILLHSEPSTSNTINTHYHILFIPGNPGLVSYYITFLHLLHSSLTSNAPKTTAVSICARSLGGFEVSRTHAGTTPLLSLDDQIIHVESTFLAHLSATAPGRVHKVILIGHSVGAFILLELLRRGRLTSASSAKVVGGILLFPTVVDIAQSSNGRKLGLLLLLPDVLAGMLGSVLGLLGRGITATLPSTWLTALLQRVLGMSREAAGVTGAFLRSSRGVEQALHMGRDEMRDITADRWDEDIWGAAEAIDKKHDATATASAAPKLFFYFGQKDHWVADRTRDDLIAARASQGELAGRGRPRMEIDTDNVPHGFCIWHNVPVSNKVALYIEEIMSADR